MTAKEKQIILLVQQYLSSLMGKPNGIATLGEDGLINSSQLPHAGYKGEFETIDNLITLYPLAEQGDYAYILKTNSFQYWNYAIKQWVSQEISAKDYKMLDQESRNVVPYVIVPE